MCALPLGCPANQLTCTWCHDCGRGQEENVVESSVRQLRLDKQSVGVDEVIPGGNRKSQSYPAGLRAASRPRWSTC